MAEAIAMRDVQVQRIGQDVCFIGYPEYGDRVSGAK